MDALGGSTVSGRFDAGKCRFCGTVALVEDLLQVPADEAGPNYICESCATERGIAERKPDEGPDEGPEGGDGPDGGDGPGGGPEAEEG